MFGNRFLSGACPLSSARTVGPLCTPFITMFRVALRDDESSSLDSIQNLLSGSILSYPLRRTYRAEQSMLARTPYCHTQHYTILPYTALHHTTLHIYFVANFPNYFSWTLNRHCHWFDELIRSVLNPVKSEGVLGLGVRVNVDSQKGTLFMNKKTISNYIKSHTWAGTE